MIQNTRRTQRTPFHTQRTKKKSSMLSSILMAMILLFAGLPPAYTEQMAEYRDNIFSFQYPAAWKRGTAKDGSLILEVAGNTESAVIAFGIATDLLVLTGDQETDAPIIRKMINEKKNTGSNLQLNGEYDMLNLGALRGFRAFGTWAGRIKAHEVILSDGAHLLAFRFIGDGVMAAEDSILASIIVTEAEKTLTRDGYALFDREKYSMQYPEGYSMLEQDTGIVFLDKTKSNMIMIRLRTLDRDYDETLAPALAVTYLPKSTKVEANPKMVKVGHWDTALITGDTSSGPMAFYALGSGRTALMLLFLGEDALAHTQTVLTSITIK